MPSQPKNKLAIDKTCENMSNVDAFKEAIHAEVEQWLKEVIEKQQTDTRYKLRLKLIGTTLRAETEQKVSGSSNSYREFRVIMRSYPHLKQLCYGAQRELRTPRSNIILEYLFSKMDSGAFISINELVQKFQYTEGGIQSTLRHFSTVTKHTGGYSLERNEEKSVRIMRVPKNEIGLKLRFFE